MLLLPVTERLFVDCLHFLAADDFLKLIEGVRAGPRICMD
jgi:hypothetical protein